MCVGPLARGAAEVFGGEWFGSKQDLESSVREMAKEMGSIVVKGSRFMKMETVVAALESAWGPNGAKPFGSSRAG
jgi:UDP-N-acetylmuramoyl-tripeptide--D-alanyl-D-alanine ligase